MKTILVATDLSARSDRAVLRAIKLAKKFNAKLIITHVVDDQVPRSMIEENKKQALAEIKACIKGRTKDIDMHIEISVGDAYIEILKTAYELHADLIVIGLHRHVEDKQPIIGNVIERLTKSSHKSLLVVKDRSEQDYKKILSALDFNNDSIEALKRALTLFNDAKFSLLHSYNVPFLGFMGANHTLEKQVIASSFEELNNIVEQVLSELEDVKAPEIENLVKEGNILNVVKEEAKYIKPNLLVFGIHGRSTFSRAVLPSASESILADPPCDVFLASNS